MILQDYNRPYLSDDCQLVTCTSSHPTSRVKGRGHSHRSVTKTKFITAGLPTAVTQFAGRSSRAKHQC